LRSPRIAWLVVALLAAASLAAAAPRRSARRTAQVESVSADVSGGLSYTHAGDAGLYGWFLSGSLPLRSRLSLVGDLTGHYGSFAGADLSQLAFMAGVRRWWPPRVRTHAVTPFVEGLVGPVHMTTSVADRSSGTTHWGFAVGGGADYAITGSWAARGLVHLRLIRGDGVWDTDPRLSIGAVYRLR
jgi:hypothetical protein